MRVPLTQILSDPAACSSPETIVSVGKERFLWGVELQYYHFIPAKKSHFPPLVLVPGLASTMENFKHLLQGLTIDFEVWYLETAEKASAETPADYPYTIDALSKDVAGYIAQQGFHRDNYILMGYSLGATVVLHCCQYLDALPVLLVVAEPSAEFAFPWWSRLMARFAPPFYPFIRPGLLWYIRHFRVNNQSDMELYHIAQRSLESAHPYRLCRTLLAIANYKCWPYLQAVSCETLIIGASQDKLHPYEETRLLAERIEKSSLEDLETNKRNHGEEAAEVIRRAVIIKQTI